MSKKEYITLDNGHLNALRTKKGGITVFVKKFLSGSSTPKKGFFKKCIGKAYNKKEYMDVVAKVRAFDKERDRPPNKRKRVVTEQKLDAITTLQKYGVHQIQGKPLSKITLPRLKKEIKNL